MRDELNNASDLLEHSHFLLKIIIFKFRDENDVLEGGGFDDKRRFNIKRNKVMINP